MLTRHTETAKPMYNTTTPFTRPTFPLMTVCLCLKALTSDKASKIPLGKGKGLDTCYSATYMNQTRDQQRFTIAEVAADWHAPMVPQRIMWPYIARANGQLDQRCS